MAFLSTPYAILPSTNDETETTVDRIILSVLDNKRYEWKNMLIGHEDSWCIGSSHDWLILLDNKGCPLLLNLSSSSFIQLPPFSHALMPHAKGSLSNPLLLNPDSAYSYYVESLRETFVYKAALMNSPTNSQYTLAILLHYPSKIAFCKRDYATWFELFDALRSYCDIVFHNNVLYALAENGWVEGWDFNQKVATKILDVKPNLEIDLQAEKKFPIDKFSTKFYLVISEGDFLLVERIIGNFVNAKGEAVYEGENLSFDHEDEICPYSTKHFIVYKLDLVNNKWEKIKSLNGQVLFLGANESASVPAAQGYQQNSIYFTDDRWEEMSLDYSYGGHDWGVFNLQDQTIKFFAPDAYRMYPPPIWVVPK